MAIVQSIISLSYQCHHASDTKTKMQTKMQNANKMQARQELNL